MPHAILLLNGKVITPLITAKEASGKYFFPSRSAQGIPFVACKLDNRKQSPFHGWYIFVSPEDFPIVERYRWCAKFAVSNGNQHIVVRRRVREGSQTYDVLLNHQIWKNMHGSDVPTLYLHRHPFDFRRSNISANSLPGADPRLLRGVCKVPYGYQVQICVDRTRAYVGRTVTRDEGYRLFNRHLRDLKVEHPDAASIQAMPYNDIEPQF